LSIRSRLIATITALTALGVLLTGGTAYLLERARVETDVTDLLTREAAEFATLATNGVDPQTGLPFDSASDLLRVALQRRVLPTSGGEMAVVGGQIEWLAADGVVVRPEDSPGLVDAIMPLTTADTVTLGRVSADGHDYAYVVVPVHTATTAGSGALVRVVDMDVELGRLDETYRTYALLAVGAVLLIACVTWLVMGRLLRPISWVRRAAEAIGENDLETRIPVRGNDDLSALTTTVNTMLDRIRDAVDGQRRLLDDVGHELRTPLTVIHGHLELMDPEVADEAAATRELALEEVTRMTGLVEDLLLLARAERGDLVAPVAVDVGRLTDETFEKARVLGDRRWFLDALADVEVMLDPGRITQAWLQLAANAVRYSPAGSRVGLGSEVRDGHLWMWVADEGVGIAAEDRELVLSRFGRAGNGHGATEGAGLGLAIVDEIARAHGGRVDIDSTLGSGSTIALVVPVVPPPSAPPTVAGSGADLEADLETDPGAGHTRGPALRHPQDVSGQVRP
jgi:signal transduction histidine kinase